MANFNSDDPEAVFGFIAASYRKKRGYSQKEMAEKLTALGMKVDASAVSRLEAGGRSLRLAEVFKIAEALDVTVATLMTFSSTPASRLRDARDRLDTSWNAVRKAVVLFLHHLEEVEEQLSARPELLSSLKDRSIETPEDARGYADWMLQRMERIADEERLDKDWTFESTFLVATEEQRARKIEVVKRLVSNFIDVGEYPDAYDEESEDDDVEHQEAP